MLYFIAHILLVFLVRSVSQFLGFVVVSSSFFSFLFSLFSFALLVLDFCLFVVVPVRSLKSVLGLLFVLPIIHSVLEFLFSCSSDRSFIRSSDRSLLSFGFRFCSARSFPQCWTSVFTPSMLD